MWRWVMPGRSSPRPNGLHWSPRASGTTLPLKGVTFGGGRFVAVGSRFDATRGIAVNVIVTSTDGLTWSAQPPFDRHGLQAIIFAEERFVAVGGDGVITSADGLTWSDWRYVGSALKGVAYGSGCFVAVGESGLYQSDDGAAWSQSGSIEGGQAITYDGNQFLAVGWSLTPTRGARLVTSPDGLAWSPSRPTEAYPEELIDGIAYGNGHYVGVGFLHASSQGAIIRSSDAATWEAIPSGSNGYLRAIIYAEGRFVAVGSQGTILTLDGTGDWTERPVRSPGNLTSIAYGAGRFVAVGAYGTLITSPDGLAWSQRNAQTTVDLKRVRYGGGRFVAIGDAGTILTSADGLTWSLAARLTGVNLLGLLYEGGGFVAVGWPGVILTSTDGSHWERQSSGTTAALNDVTFGEGRYYALGSGVLLTSADVTTWSQSELSTETPIWRATYLGGRLFAQSAGGTGMLATDDGADLNLSRAPWMWSLSEAARGNGWDVTVGGIYGLIYSSRDSIDWQQGSGETASMLGIAYGDGRFVAVGQSGIRTAVAPPAQAEGMLPLPDRIQIHRPTIAAPPAFADLTAEHWAFRSVGVATNTHFLLGYPDGRFMPEQPITRAEFLAVVMRAYPQPDLRGEEFADVPPEHWAYELILQARGAGLVQGDAENYFYPDANINRAEMAVILQRALSLPLPSDPVEFPDLTAEWDWAVPAVEALTAHGLLRGFPDGAFGPGASATRAETAAVLARLFHR